jgi:hypothetical protein
MCLLVRCNLCWQLFLAGRDTRLRGQSNGVGGMGPVLGLEDCH